MSPDLLDAWADLTVRVAVHGAVKTGLLLASALALVRLARGLSAALKHRVLQASLIGSLAIGPLVAALPSWGPSLPLPRVATVRPGDPAPAGKPAAPGPRLADSTPPAHGGPDTTGPAGAAALLGLWLTGLALGLVRSIADHRARRRLLREAAEVADPGLLAAVAECSAELGVRRPVRVLLSPSARVPLTWGIRRPRLVLPADAASWTAARLRVVLLHELAHVLRRDARSRLLGEVATRLLWFHPLAWSAARRLSLESEHACDDLVLSRNVSPAVYVEELIALVRRLRHRRRPLPVLAATGARDLERRFLAIVDHRRPRSAPPRALAAATAVAVLALATGLAGFASPQQVDRDSSLAGATEIRVDAILAPRLERVLDRGLQTDEVETFLRAAATLEADAARENVLVRLLRSRSLTRPEQLTVVALVDGMNAVAARESAFCALARSQDLSPAARREIERAAARLDRPSARRNVLRCLSRRPR